MSLNWYGRTPRCLLRVLLGLALAGGVAHIAVGCSDDEGGCAKDDDCATPLICAVDGRCVDPESSAMTASVTGATATTATTGSSAGGGMGAGGGAGGEAGAGGGESVSNATSTASTASTSTSSTGAGGSGPTCGDGKLEEGEECDDGNGNLLCSGCEACTKQHILDLPAQAYVKSAAAQNALPSATTDACYEVWGKTDGSVNDAIYFASVSSTTSINVILRCLSGNVVFAVQKGNSVLEVATSASCGDNQWHHVAGCRDVDGSSVTLTLYVDGKLAGSVSGSTASIALPTDVYVGGVNYQQDGLAGAIDEVRVSNTLRYTGDFVPARHFTTDAKTSLLWHFNDGSGDTITDASGYGYSGAIVGGTFGPDTGYRPEFCQAN